MPDSPRPEGQGSDTPTRVAARDPDPAARAGSRFVPGTLLDRRYRIIGLLGRGGMGEVYRADDLKLGEPVALKFLPPGLERDDQRLRLLLEEVRIARQVSHPHVCRVHDVGEVEGRQFLSMEYVDGEDLGSLLRRIGRLPRDKAIEVARQMCAGLAAAHGQGVLHRDLKPANVMLDGRGRVRLTDFGLAVMAESRQGSRAESRAGTPLYMAPEQREGRAATVRSDIYSLGLVLHELFTGRLPVGPTGSTAHGEELDPAVGEVIRRCLNADPALRPASALAVAAALPGFDPIAAALAAGETPSPDMIAASGGKGSLSPAVAWALLASGVAALASIALLSGLFTSTREEPPRKSPDALADRAREILQTIGHQGRVLDEAWGFERGSESSAGPRSATIDFWYRSSPAYLIADNLSWQVTPTKPSPTLPGMATVRLDPQGRLVALDMVPPDSERPQSVPHEPDWSMLLSAAGLAPGAFTPVEPTAVPATFADTRVAWVGNPPDGSNQLLRVEAAAFQGSPVSFRVSLPRAGSADSSPEGEEFARMTDTVFNTFLLVALIGGCLLARRNIRLGRGDRVGATRVALFFFVTHVVVWFLFTHHVPSFRDETTALTVALGSTLFSAGMLWLLYVALEPFVRRNWPEALIAWSRLLGGGFRDPRVGRDVLIGASFGAAIFLLMQTAWLAGWLVKFPGPPGEYLSDLLGLRWSLAHLLDRIAHSITDSTLFLFLLMVLRITLRRTWMAWLAFLGIVSLLGVPATGGAPAGMLIVVVMFALNFLLMVRFGLLAAIAAAIVYTSLTQSPIAWGGAAWPGSGVLLPLLGSAALAVLGFRIALAGQPLFGGALLDE